jgi:hypothetical protein
MTIKALYPTVRPSLNLDFAKTKALDPRITFTRASAAIEGGANGLIQTAASGAARFDHNPATGESLGLLVEEARTNLLLQSSALTTASWGLTNVTRTANSTTAPDGTNTAVKIASTTGTWQSFLSQVSVAGITAVPTTFSCYAKAAEASWFCLAGIQYGEAIAYFNLATGALGTRSAGSAHSITPVGNGWYRCSVTCASASSTQWGFFPANTDNTLTPAPIGNGVHVWGPQLEAGAFPTSYIPTTTATVTRAADVASITGTNLTSWYKQSASTIIAEYNIRVGMTSGNYPSICGFDQSGGFPGVVACRISQGTQINTFSQSDSATVNLTVTNQKHKSAHVIAETTSTTKSIATCFDGGSVASNTSTATASTHNIFTIGLSYGGNYLGNPIARLTYYPVRLPDAQLQALTAT